MIKKAGYNISGVIFLTTKVEQLLREILALPPLERENLLKLLNDRIELCGWLKVSETAFSDWNNEEDAVYDHI